MLLIGFPHLEDFVAEADPDAPVYVLSSEAEDCGLVYELMVAQPDTLTPLLVRYWRCMMSHREPSLGRVRTWLAELGWFVRQARVATPAGLELLFWGHAECLDGPARAEGVEDVQY